MWTARWVRCFRIGWFGYDVGPAWCAVRPRLDRVVQMVIYVDEVIDMMRRSRGFAGRGDAETLFSFLCCVMRESPVLIFQSDWLYYSPEFFVTLYGLMTRADELGPGGADWFASVMLGCDLDQDPELVRLFREVVS